MTQVTINEVPKSVRNRGYFLLGRQIFKCIKELGWEYYEQRAHDSVLNSDLIYDLLKERLTESILTAQAVLEGKLKKPWRVLTYTLFPPIVAIRSDTQQGSMKLLFGSDVDCSYVIASEISDAMFVVNCSLNDGMPIDWWLAGPDDEILDRRHLKLGTKLKDLPIKMKKGLSGAATRMIDILKDVRNERDPHRSNAMYHVGLTYISGVFNTMFEWKSNYDAYGAFWDGLQSKKFYNLQDSHFNFVPHPPILKTLIRAGRRAFMKKWSSWAGNKLFINHIEPIILDWIKSKTPEIFNLIFIKGIEEGIPFPVQSMVSGMDLKKNFDLSGRYFNDVNSPKIRVDDLKLSSEEVFNGVYLRVDRKTPPTEHVDESSIISLGLGRNARIFQD
ncbi:MAG: hypothetical protein ACTSSI_12235 [Candidatus Helarchaeota archaeon]